MEEGPEKYPSSLVVLHCDLSSAWFPQVSADGGTTWTTIGTLGNGQDTSTFYTGSEAVAAADNNPNVVFRYQDFGDAMGDYCYVDDMSVTGIALGGPAERHICLVGCKLGFLQQDVFLMDKVLSFS